MHFSKCNAFTHAFSLIPTLLFASNIGAAAQPLEARESTWENLNCLSDADAKFLVDIIVSVSVKFDINYVTPYFSDDFIVQSDSINFLIGQSPGVITADKNTFLQSSLNLTTTTVQPIILVSNIMHSCDEIAFRWQSQTMPYVVQGIDYMHCVNNGDHWQIQADYSEFNIGADLVDNGLFPCPGTSA